jgi:hypothetical protein
VLLEPPVLLVQLVQLEVQERPEMKVPLVEPELPAKLVQPDPPDPPDPPDLLDQPEPLVQVVQSV